MKFEEVPTSKAEEKNNKKTESSYDVKIRVEKEKLARRRAEKESNERFNADKKDDKETDIESREVGKENISENLAHVTKSFSDVRKEVEEKRLARRKAEKRGF